MQEDLSGGSNRTRVSRHSIPLTGAKGWVHCALCLGLRTDFRSKDFVVWLQCFSKLFFAADACRLTLGKQPRVPPNSKAQILAPRPCPKPGCPELLDIHGDHLRHCCYGFDRNNRDKNQVVLLGNHFARRDRRAFIERGKTWGWFATIGEYVEIPLSYVFWRYRGILCRISNERVMKQLLASGC